MWDRWRHALLRAEILSVILILGLFHQSVAQSHRWDVTYTDCTASCGGGTQDRLDRCYTTSTPSQMAPVGYCNSLPPPTGPSVRSCNTQPCTMCDRTYTALTGTLSSPYWPDKNTIPRYCRLAIEVESQKRILLAFTEFRLEGVDLFSPTMTEEDVCLCGVLIEINDGGRRLNRYCGTKKPFAWVSETSQVMVEFITSYSLVFNRFIANYSTITPQPSCYEFIDLTGFTDNPLPQEGFLHSANFPNPYPDNQHCEYVLHANPEHRIILYFDEFELEPGQNCEADYVKVEDLYSRRFDIYCGKHHSFSWLSDSNEIWITFRTNNQQVYSGFLLAYELMDRKADNMIVLEEAAGVFASPGFPLMYNAHESVEYVIRTNPRNLLIVTFHDFELERDDDAPVPIRIAKRSTLNEYQNHFGDPYAECLDYVRVMDIFDNSEERYCGRIPVFSYISRGNELLLQFNTDGSMQYRGFNASYRSIPRREPTDWEIVYRVARGGETETVDKFLFQPRGFNEFNPRARDTTLTRSRDTFKSPDVRDWDSIGVRKVKIDVYTAGSIRATFRFQGQGSSITSWFDCERMIYSGYSDLNSRDCEDLVFALLDPNDMDKEFEIATSMNQTLTCDTDLDRLVWLDIQDVASAMNCTYEAPRNRLGNVQILNSIIFISSADTGGLSATGGNIAEADVFTISVQRDCDVRLMPNRSDEFTINSNGYGVRDYENNEYCDIFMTVHPFDRLFIEFEDFELEEDDCLQNDYVQIENVDTAFTQTFCGKQHQVVWTTTSNAAILRFRTDSIVTYNGWSAEVTAQRRNLEDCSVVSVNPTGNMSNPEYPKSLQEYRYYGCEYIVHAHPNDRVIVSFSAFIFQTENPPEMQIDPRTSTINFIEVSGILFPFSWTSETNELAVSYHAPLPYRTYILYQASYRTLDAPRPATCQTMHEGDFGGTFDWPVEALSTGLQNCYVIIRTDPDEKKRIQLIFRNLKMPQSDCNSYINTLDTTTQRNDMYCQRIRIPFAWTSDANEVVVQFFHGPTFALHQVNVEFRSRERVRPEDAFVFIDQAGGAFTTPNYPHPYTPDRQIEFLLHAPPEHLVIVVFKDFSIEGPVDLRDLNTRRRRSVDDMAPDHAMYKRQLQQTGSRAECRYDSVTVEDVLENTETVYCGDQQPFGVATQGNEAIILFITDMTVEKRGFDALYAFEPRPVVSGCGQLFTTNFGILQSPNYPNRYPNAAYCRDVIQVSPQNRIIINLQFLSIEDDEDCSKDYLEIRDVVTGKKQTYCGQRTSPLVWRSDSNLVFLTFVSDASNPSSGYDGTYNTEDRSNDPTCVYNITAPSGTIHSPLFPRDYANQLMCEYNITVGVGYGIQLNFQEFMLEPPSRGSTECIYDYIQIIDPTTVNVVTAEKLCGTKNPFERQILHNQVTIIFKSDFITFYKGFLADFQQISLNRSPTSNAASCDAVLTGSAGYFSSPGYPGNYPDNSLCVIRITVAEYYHIVITFNDFNTEGYTGCPYDFVKVQDVVTGLEEKFCGRYQAPFSWTSNSNQVVVTFQSDDRTPSSGFYASYESQPDVQQNAPAITGCENSAGYTVANQDSGEIHSPNFPDFYPLYVDCVVRIDTPPGYVCQVRFTFFELEDSQDCAYDFVKVKCLGDGSTEKFCGARAPFTWTSKSSSCEIHFRSDSYVTAPGYTAEFSSVPATGINAPSGPYGPPAAPPAPYGPAPPAAPPAPYGPAPPAAPPAPYAPAPPAAPPAPYAPAAPPAPYGPAPPAAPPAPYGPAPPAAPPAPYAPAAPPAPYAPAAPPAPYGPAPPAAPPAPYAPAAPPVTSCDQNLKALSGIEQTITSPNWDNDYPLNTRCEITITADYGRILIIFSHFEFEDSAGCEFDYLTISEGTNPQPERLCGTKAPFVFASTTSAVTLTFVSDAYVAAKGFSAKYSQI